MQDVENILLHTERTWGKERGATYASAMARALALLRDHPQFGRQRDDLCLGCRSVQVEQHITYYHKPRDDEIEVLRILHRRQDASSEVASPSS
jgi:toxin ParE1/3/4